MHSKASEETSVTFNLRQLMELEAERLAREAEAARAEALAEEQRRASERRASEEARAARARAAAEREREATLEVQRVEHERAATLLRVHLESEARARIELERLALEREQVALDSIRAQRNGARRHSLIRVAVTMASLAGAWVGGSAMHTPISAAPTMSATMTVPECPSLAPEKTVLDVPPQPTASAVAPSSEPVPPPSRANRSIGPRSTHGGPPPRRVPHRKPADELNDLDVEGSDPLGT